MLLSSFAANSPEAGKQHTLAKTWLEVWFLGVSQAEEQL
jgi:hypothetical protein